MPYMLLHTAPAHLRCHPYTITHLKLLRCASYESTRYMLLHTTPAHLRTCVSMDLCVYVCETQQVKRQTQIKEAIRHLKGKYGLKWQTQTEQVDCRG